MSLEEHYPIDCAFCKISAAYAAETSTTTTTSSSPIPSSADPTKLSPQCHLILSAPRVLAFLDIMPIAPGHILLTTRQHYRKLSDLQPATSAGSSGGKGGGDGMWAGRRAAEEARETARALGEWLPVLSRALCRVTGVEDWNVVQNNGERAAQVVPHVHFHLIPRYQEGRRPETTRHGRTDSGQLKSWKMFGRGSREDLDDEEGAELARRLREALREEVEGEGEAAAAARKARL